MPQDFLKQNILIGISGGIAAYKVAYLVRELTKLGANVKVVMTEEATRFVSPLTFQALSKNPVYTSLWDAEAGNGMTHIDLARWADVLLIAPATANLIAKLAAGFADDLLTTMALIVEKPFILCPAMNHSMWANKVTQENVSKLIQRDVFIIEPLNGEAACGEVGIGRLCDITHILQILRLYQIRNILPGKTCIITAGPTKERIDSVRYLTNESSGKMGYALAYAAYVAGAKVTLISGPSSLTAPPFVKFIQVESAADMLQAVKKHICKDCIFIGCAAVSDYKSATHYPLKLKKTPKLTLKLTQTADILKYVAESKLPLFVAGFAAETNNLLQFAKEKLISKNANLIIANQVGENVGFNADYHSITLVTKNETIAIEKMHKVHLAARIMQFISEKISRKLISADQAAEL
ncbi:MAG: phosphopantothenoylcysteine decarboxylase [Legionellales bacterium RIFCSPHIGHO2_12_FULL_37_14]|nr:MAG: phosphopantothenoylcysteine decarboxylase [Legionellales bacterium RIFCSPHIGHO2_12_FULL_37_14]